MKRKHEIFRKVAFLYTNTERNFSQWMWENHVKVVASYAEELAERFGGNIEYCYVGGLLHDIGDVWMDRSDEGFEEKSQEEGRKIMEETGFDKSEIKLILDRIIAPHSCYPENMPTTLEGKIVATADAIAHLKTDIYEELKRRGLPKYVQSGKFNEWVKIKLDRDFERKIFWEDIQEKVRQDYEKLKSNFI